MSHEPMRIRRGQLTASGSSCSRHHVPDDILPVSLTYDTSLSWDSLSLMILSGGGTRQQREMHHRGQICELARGLAAASRSRGGRGRRTAAPEVEGSRGSDPGGRAGAPRRAVLCRGPLLRGAVAAPRRRKLPGAAAFLANAQLVPCQTPELWPVEPHNSLAMIQKSCPILIRGRSIISSGPHGTGTISKVLLCIKCLCGCTCIYLEFKQLETEQLETLVR